MRREELGVEKPETANPQARDEPRHGDLRGVGLPREHALAEKGGTQRHTVKAARQLSFMPAFHRMGVSALEQLHIGINDHRSEESRVGKECVRTGRSRWSPDP